MSQVANRSTVPVSLATGRVLAPGERAETELTDEEMALAAAGVLVVFEEPAVSSARKKTQDAPGQPRAVEGSGA